MYHASDEFHAAVANGAHQIALLIFDRGSTDAELAVFTNDDINVSTGIEFNDYFNTQEDIAIGQALSNEISFNLFNDQGRLNDYEFGEFKATIGAQVGDAIIPDHKQVYIESADDVFETFPETPFLKKNNVAVASQPDYPIVSILIYGGNVYCGLEDGNVKTYDYNDMSVVSYTPNDHMKEQFQRWKGKGIGYYRGDDGANDIMQVWQRNHVLEYEFVPLGIFVAERPNVPSVNEIHFTCYDRMQDMEKDMVPFSDLMLASGTSTIAELYTAICDYVGINCREQTLINGNATVKETDDFNNVTMREVLQWIAEACAGVARIDRDGYMHIDWIRTDTGIEIDETGYSEFNPYWYETKRVTKVCNRASNGAYDTSSGTGDEAYLIQDNPLLKGVS